MAEGDKKLNSILVLVVSFSIFIDASIFRIFFSVRLWAESFIGTAESERVVNSISDY